MTQVSPSLLAADFACLGAQSRMVLDAGAQMLHFDVMDGHFVPNLSFGIPVLQSLHRALPGAFYDVHLMISRPLDYVTSFAKAGANLITFHLESEGDPVRTIEAIHEAGCQAGLALRPGTPVQAAVPYLAKLELVLVMCVEPGFGGQSFQPAALERLHALRGQTDALLQVDGGINRETGAACVQAGADVLVAGSAIFGASDPVAEVQALCALQRA